MYKIAICDNQEIHRREIYKKVMSYAEKCSILLTCHLYQNSAMLIADIEEKYYFDIIFIDIEMPRINGLEAIKKINKMLPLCLKVIVSSYTKYAIDAINLDVFRYLVKGYMDSTIVPCLDAAFNRLSVSNKKNYLIVSAKKYCKICCDGILYCYKNVKSSILITKNGQIKERKTLQNLLRDLNSIQDCFIQIERSHIVNLYYIEKFHKNEIYLSDETVLPVGGAYSDSVKYKLDLFWRKQMEFYIS